MEVSGGKSDKALYQQEVQKGVKLFEAGFKDLQQSKIDEQKDLFEKSMRESLQVIQDAAAALMNKSLLKMKDQLANDYQNYLTNPSADNRDKIQRDIDSLKKSTNA